TLSNHGYTPYALLASKQVWDKLNPDEQKLLRAAADEAKVFERTYSRSNSAKMIAELKKKVTVTELSQQEQARFQEKAKPIYAKFSESIDPAFAKGWFAALQSLR
ncbi:MAG: TRAP transporter substrate-binding protein, partial [Pseudogulbenkiania sp.]|nr:TRAP transporter substrate-binding protein [Pseudogulbenkiania sp.]